MKIVIWAFANQLICSIIWSKPIILAGILQLILNRSPSLDHHSLRWYPCWSSVLIVIRWAGIILEAENDHYNALISRRSLEAGELLLKEKPLLTMTTPHTPKTLAKYVAELRQKVSKCWEQQCHDNDNDVVDDDHDDAAHGKKHILSMAQGYSKICENVAVEVLMTIVQVRALTEEKLEDFFHLSIARFTLFSCWNFHCKVYIVFLLKSPLQGLHRFLAEISIARFTLFSCWNLLCQVWIIF